MDIIDPYTMLLKGKGRRVNIGLVCRYCIWEVFWIYRQKKRLQKSDVQYLRGNVASGKWSEYWKCFENKKLCYIDAQQNKILHLESVLEVVRLNICRSCLRTLLRENLFWPNVNISRERLSLVWHQGWRQKLLLTTIGGKYMLMDQRNTEKHEIIWF